MAKAAEVQDQRLIRVAPRDISKNPNNPRRYFNDEALDSLRTSVQEVGVLVPLIAYEDPKQHGKYVLMDGERRWTSAIELGLTSVPVSLISAPTPLENLLRMFNIHSVREDWPLISVALSLADVMRIGGETRESRLAEMTGVTRGTVRRAKRLLQLPERELQLIRDEAHLDREKQMHREDLYIEILDAISAISRVFPEIVDRFGRPRIVRSFVRKREDRKLKAVTDFRYVVKIAKAVSEGILSHRRAATQLTRLIEERSVTPLDVWDRLGRPAEQQGSLRTRALLLRTNLASIDTRAQLSPAFVRALKQLKTEIERLLS